jgi:hypothetical protein
MSKSTISSEPEAEQLLTSQTSQFNLWTEHQYPLREGWVGLTAGLVNLDRTKILSLLGLKFGVLVGRLVGLMVSGMIIWLVGW